MTTDESLPRRVFKSQPNLGPIMHKAFPWLRGFAQKEKCSFSDARVEEITLALMERSGYVERPIAWRSYKLRFYLVGKAGEIPSVTHQEQTWHRKYWLFGPLVFGKPQVYTYSGKLSEHVTVGYGLEVLGVKATDVHFIIAYNADKNSIIIYRAPGNGPLVPYIKQLTAQKEEELKSQLAEDLPE